jgi:hypothetical protein
MKGGAPPLDFTLLWLTGPMMYEKPFDADVQHQLTIPRTPLTFSIPYKHPMKFLSKDEKPVSE